jgi:hypothetical protein
MRPKDAKGAQKTMGNKPIRTLSATEVKNRFGAVLREVARTGDYATEVMPQL